MLAGLSAALIAFIVMNGSGSKNTDGSETKSETASNTTSALASSTTDEETDGPTSGNDSTAKVIAVATPDGSKQALILELDPEAESALIRPVGVTVDEGRDLEIWRITSQNPPVSLGLVAPYEETTVSLKLDAGDTIVVTLEPEGGSTNGSPSGPTVFSAPLIKVPE